MNCSTENIDNIHDNQISSTTEQLIENPCRMSMSSFTIGENVTIVDRDMSVDSTTDVTLETPSSLTNEPFTPPVDSLNLNEAKSKDDKDSNLSLDTPLLCKREDPPKQMKRPHNLLKLMISKTENDVFAKPSPLSGVMSPAKMLQFEVEPSSATPTMKRAAIDFDFFNKNNFEEYFNDVPKNVDETTTTTAVEKIFKETPVIVQPKTIRHEIGYGKNVLYIIIHFIFQNFDTSFSSSFLDISVSKRIRLRIYY